MGRGFIQRVTIALCRHKPIYQNIGLLGTNPHSHQVGYQAQKAKTPAWRRGFFMHAGSCRSVSYTHLTLPTTPYV